MVYLKSVENVITLGKLIGLLFLFCLPLLSILFLKAKRNDLARPVMGTIFLVSTSFCCLNSLVLSRKVCNILLSCLIFEKNLHCCLIDQKRIFLLSCLIKIFCTLTMTNSIITIFLDSSISLMETLNTSEVPMKRLDLSSAFEGSAIFRHTQSQLQPLMQSMAGTVKHNSSLFTNSIDQYATNALWQVRHL